MKRLFHIISLLAVIFLTGCTAEKELQPESGCYISFTTITSHSDESDTRGIPGEESYNENKVSRLDLFFFRENGTLLYYPEPTEIVQTGNNIQIKIPDDITAQIIGTPMNLYVLANCNRPRAMLEGKSLSGLEALIQENAVTFNSTVFVPQENFLMSGTIPLTINSTSQNNLGTVDLRRAAAKVSVNIGEAHIDNYTPQSARLRLCNFIDKTLLLNNNLYSPVAGDYKSIYWRDMSRTGSGGVYSFNGTPFYSYARNWSSDPDHATYMILEMTWKNDVLATEGKYYYYIPFDYIPVAKDGIDHNYIYQFNLDIHTLGGLDPETAVELTPNFNLIDWTTHQIGVSIDEYNYLLIKEQNVAMNNISSRTIGFKSSHDISIQTDSSYYYKYANSGKITKESYPAPQYTIDQENQTFTVTSTVPNNYVPAYFTLTVMNAKGLKQSVRIVQYPRIFITSKYSADYLNFYGWLPSKYNNGIKDYERPLTNDPNHSSDNHNFYTVTIQSVSPTDPYRIGDPTEWNDQYQTYVTQSSEESNQIVSPQFVIASRRGKSGEYYYDHAQRRCSSYQELPYMSGSWRMPTMAEMKLISALQNDPNSAIKDLFTANYQGITWWTAIRYKGLDISTAIAKDRGYTIPDAIRCVHDVWRD